MGRLDLEAGTWQVSMRDLITDLALKMDDAAVKGLLVSFAGATYGTDPVTAEVQAEKYLVLLKKILGVER
jgi:hypothetical protein